MADSIQLLTTWMRGGEESEGEETIEFNDKRAYLQEVIRHTYCME